MPYRLARPVQMNAIALKIYQRQYSIRPIAYRINRQYKYREKFHNFILCVNKFHTSYTCIPRLHNQLIIVFVVRKYDILTVDTEKLK
jgi:hypothetical protein